MTAKRTDGHITPDSGAEYVQIGERPVPKIRNNTPTWAIEGRTDRQWRSCPLGWAGLHALLQLKSVFSVARESGVDIEDGSYVKGVFQQGIAAYEEARTCWFVGDDEAAGRFVVLMGVFVGLAARDNSKLADEVIAASIKKANDARHAQDRAAREEAVALYQNGSFRSKELAAAAIALKVNKSRVTVRRWLQNIVAPRRD